MTVCPLHNDTKPSLAIYQDGCHCFGCGFHGSRLALLLAVYAGKQQALVAYVRGEPEIAHVSNPKRFDLGPQLSWQECPPELLEGIRVSRETLQMKGTQVYAWCLGLPINGINEHGDLFPSLVLRRAWRPRYVHMPGFPAGRVIGLARYGRPAILVEGVLDAWRLEELGWRGGLLVLLGTGVSGWKAAALRRCAPEGILSMLDNDEAGRRATHELSRLLPVVSVPYEAEDPQALQHLPEALVRQGGGGLDE